MQSPDSSACAGTCLQGDCSATDRARMVSGSKQEVDAKIETAGAMILRAQETASRFCWGGTPAASGSDPGVDGGPCDGTQRGLRSLQHLASVLVQRHRLSRCTHTAFAFALRDFQPTRTLSAAAEEGWRPTCTCSTLCIQFRTCPRLLALGLSIANESTS